MEIENYRSRPENLNLSKRLNVIVWVITVAVLGLVGLMQQVKIDLPEGVEFSFLPPFHAALNTLAAVFLFLAVVAIKNGQVKKHQNFIYAAFVCSLIFLLSYVTYHFTTPATLYGDIDGNGTLSDAEKNEAGGLRIFYLFILLTHIALAAVSFPFILQTAVFSLTNQFEKHRVLARRIFPVWLYVAVTGPIVYLLLRPYY